MSLAPIGSLPTLQPLQPAEAARIAPPVDKPSADGSFGDMVAGAVEHLNSVHAKADDLAVQAATGKLTDVHDYMIAATQAQHTTELTVAVRNRAVEAFNDIMRMQI
jgi:flagellar hook-basal body complex protein FliE